jgi:hypothetical protein
MDVIAMTSAELAAAMGHPDAQAVTIPADVSVYASGYGNMYYVVYAHRAIEVSRQTGSLTAFSVFQERSWTGFHFSTLSLAMGYAFRLIDELRQAGVALVHRRDGMYVRTQRSPEPTLLDYVRNAQAHQAHRLWVTTAKHLDFFGHILVRCGLNTDALMRNAAGIADNSMMRNEIAVIAQRLRERAGQLDSEVRQRAEQPQRRAESGERRSRRSTNLAFDARALRGLARVIEKDAGDLGPQPGDHVVRFRNAINARGREQHVRHTVEEARALARDYRPYNNTDVTIHRVVSVHFDTVCYDEVPLDSAASQVRI